MKSSSGGAATRKALANKEMAARMKREGVDRHVMRCPICHCVISRSGMPFHIRKCS